MTGQDARHPRSARIIMSEIIFTSVLRNEHADELDQILFFHGDQAKLARAISFVAERYGAPRVHVIGEQLRVDLDSPIGVQSLFVIERTNDRDQLAGVVVYTREGSTFVVLYVAVHEDYTSRGIKGDRMVLLRMLDVLKSVARRVKGVSSIDLFLGGPAAKRMHLRRGWQRMGK